MLWEVLCDYVCVKIFSPKPDFVRPFFSTKAYVSNIRLSKNFFSGSNICTTTTYNYLSRTNEAAKGNIHFYLVVMGSLKSFRFLQKMTASFEPWLSSFCSLWGSKKRPLWPSNEMIFIYRKWHFPAKWAFGSFKERQLLCTFRKKGHLPFWKNFLKMFTNLRQISIPICHSRHSTLSRSVLHFSYTIKCTALVQRSFVKVIVSLTLEDLCSENSRKL